MKLQALILNIKFLSSDFPPHVQVDCRAAGNGPLNINVEDDDHNLIPVKVSETQPNCYDVSFVPSTALPHFVTVNYNDFNIKGSPFKVNVMARPEKDINLGKY